MITGAPTIELQAPLYATIEGIGVDVVTSGIPLRKKPSSSEDFDPSWEAWFKFCREFPAAPDVVSYRDILDEAYDRDE